jgi:hypothetical protein
MYFDPSDGRKHLNEAKAFVTPENLSINGQARYRELPTGSIGVLESPDNAMPFGQADCVTWNEDGLAVWRLRIRGQSIPGQWVIIGRQFKPAAR